MQRFRLLKILISVICAIFFTCVAYVAVVFFILYSSIPEEHRIAFDSQQWKQTTLSFDDPVRIQMVDDLLDQHELKGLSRAALVSLLGEPREDEDMSICDLTYWLGPERGIFSIDSEWLCINLEGDTVAEADIVTD